MNGAAMVVGAEGVAVEAQPAFEVAGMQFEQAEVPVEMAEQSAAAIVDRQPVAQKGDAGVALAGFVTEMGEGMRAIAIAPVPGQGPLDHRARLVVPADLRQCHPAMPLEPPILAIVRGEPVEEVGKVLLASRKPRHADQSALVGGQAEHQRVARPSLHVGAQRGQRGDRLAGEQRPKDLGLAPLARRDALGERGGQGEVRAHRLQLAGEL